MTSPILLLRAGEAPSTTLAPELLRCEGFPWFSEARLADVDTPPPGVRLLVVAGDAVEDDTATRVAAAVHGGVGLIALAPSPAWNRAFGFESTAPLTDARLVITDLPDWEHGDLPLLCPGAGAAPLAHGAGVGTRVAAFDGGGGPRYGSAIVHLRTGAGQVWLCGYDLCRVIADLRHGDGRLEPADIRGRTWGGPRAYHGFVGLAEKLPQDVPVADLHLDVLRSLVTQALRGAGLPRLWPFRDAAPSVVLVRGDGCGEQGVEREVELCERLGARLTFCRPHRSAYPGEPLRRWRAAGHGVSIELNINAVTQQTVDDEGDTRAVTAAEINAGHLDVIRQEIVAHRDRFRDETGLDTTLFMTHSAQWTGLPMAEMAADLGFRVLLPFQSMDPRWPAGVPRLPYVMPTALPLRYCDRDAGVLDLWHIPYQWIDLPWQTVAARVRHGNADLDALEALVGEDGRSFGARIAHFAADAARRWHVAQLCSFHPVYVSRDWPVLGSSAGALEQALRGAADAGARFDDLERWFDFVRGRDAVRLIDWRRRGETTELTLRTDLAVRGLTLVLPADVTAVRAATGEDPEVHRRHLEGREQRVACLDLPAGRDVGLGLLHATPVA